MKMRQLSKFLCLWMLELEFQMLIKMIVGILVDLTLLLYKGRFLGLEI